MLQPVNPMSTAGQLNTDIQHLKSEIKSEIRNFSSSIYDVRNRQNKIIDSIKDIGTICEKIFSRLEICEEKLRILETKEVH